jgi:hypothetical protein
MYCAVFCRHGVEPTQAVQADKYFWSDQTLFQHEYQGSAPRNDLGLITMGVE